MKGKKRECLAMFETNVYKIQKRSGKFIGTRYSSKGLDYDDTIEVTDKIWNRMLGVE